MKIDAFSWYALWSRLTESQVIVRFAYLLTAILIVTLCVRAWNPPFPYRHGYVPARAIVARIPFEVLDQKQTEMKRAQAGREVLCFYKNTPQALVQLRSGVREYILRFKSSANFDALNEEQRNALKSVPASQADGTVITPLDVYDAINDLLKDEAQIDKLDTALTIVFNPIEETGLLENLEHSLEEGNQRAIRVFTLGKEDESIEVDVKRVRIVEALPVLHESLRRELRKQFSMPETTLVADVIFEYMRPRLQSTLTWDRNLTRDARLKRELEVKPTMIKYFPSGTPMISGGKPLAAVDIELLRAEYNAWISQQSWLERLIRFSAYFGMLAALALLCGLFIYFQLDRTLLTDNAKLLRLLGLSTTCVLLCAFAAQDPWRARVLPLVLCAMTSTIVFGRSVALMLMTALSLAITLTLGMDLAEFVISLSVCAASILLLGRIRTIKKPTYVACGAAVVVALTTLGVGAMVGQVNGISQDAEAVAVVATNPPTDPVVKDSAPPSLLRQLSWEALRHAGFTILAGIMLVGLLPGIEKIFDVQTDITLLQIGDASHALLRQLAQRAPGTYNHSITVAAIAEAAAESIGANGLLTRVGAYFHDIGKMFKPNYFIENQNQGINCHDTLQPAMSTLVIIAHVKDGADLARQHKLPKTIIDFIEQHHGTTLVEYFFKQATKKSEEANNGTSQVSEAAFRYPGPKPQTLEAAVLMISDAVESASRTIVEPTPAKLQNLIEAITMKKLTDGQFDDCGLTLTQLNIVKTAVLKSLTAIYHHRVKYDQDAE